jgi:LmbE family N-acetylglucosaminyl deacetylase
MSSVIIEVFFRKTRLMITIKNKSFKILFILIVFLISPIRVKATTQANLLNISCVWTINGQDAPEALKDASIKSSYLFEKDKPLTIECSTPIKYLYILFDRPTTLYTITTPTSTQSAGFFGFLHELITLNTASTTVTLNLNPGRVASIFVYSEGTLPSTVQVWKTPANDADLLVFAAHSDDEALYFGPAIVKSVDAKKIVQVAYLTQHFSDRRRPHETLDSLWELGVTNYPIFGPFPDQQTSTLSHAYTIFPKEKVLAYEILQIRRFKPEVILSHDFAGEYGHGAHMVLSDVLKEAILKSGDINSFTDTAVIYGTFTPLKVYFHLYDQHQIILDVYTPLPSFDDRSPLEVARAAYEYHVTQHIWPLKVIDYTVGDVRKFGLYSTLVGDDTGNDLFEHVPPKPTIEDKPKPDPDVDPPSSIITESQIKTLILWLGSGVILSVSVSAIILATQGRLKRPIRR